MPLFPIFVKLEGRRVLLVGAGPVGESKVDGLIAAGALVTVVAPKATPRIAKLAEDGRLVWHAREFVPTDLDNATFVVAAVPKEVASAIYDEARRRNVLCNSVDDIENCDFYYPAVVTRGDFQIAISTAGHSPALAQRLRAALEQQFGPEYADWVQRLGAARQELFATDMDPEARKRKLHDLAAEVPGPIGPGLRTAEGPDLRTAEGPGLRTAGGHVYLVGAGPGDPELLTLKALRVLKVADVVLHDDLLTPEILALIPPGARIESVGKRHGERQVPQQEINRLLCEYGAAGHTVVRLKGGDGAIFGRASEEMDALRAAGVPFSIVPGVTAASGAAAAARVSLTDRRLGSTLLFLTAQRCKGNPPPDWKAIAQLEGTTAIYMPGGHEAELATQLMEAGMPSDARCFVVSAASRPEEHVVETTLGAIPTLDKLPAPALLLIRVAEAESRNRSKR